MTWLLERILDVLIGFVCIILAGLVHALNFVLDALGALVEAAIGALPEMPELPAVPAIVEDGFAFGGYWFPLDWLVSTMTLIAGLWIAWLVIAIPLRWAKATDG